MAIFDQNNDDGIRSDLGEQFLRDAVELYQIQHPSGDPVNLSYVGSSEQDLTKFPSVHLRDLVSGGTMAKSRFDEMVGRLFIKSRQFKDKQEESAMLKRLSESRTSEDAYAIIDEHMYGLADPEKLSIFSALTKLKNKSDELHTTFENLSKDQNPVVARIYSLKTDHNEAEFNERASYFGWSHEYPFLVVADGVEKAYAKEDYLSDLKRVRDGEVPSAAFFEMVKSRMSNEQKEDAVQFFNPAKSNVASPAFVAERDAYIAKYVAPILDTVESNEHDRLLFAHNNAAYIANKITIEAFFQNNTDSFSIADCVPIKFPNPNMPKDDQKHIMDDNIKRAENMDKMLAFALRKLKSTDTKFSMLLKDHPGLEEKIVTELKDNLVRRPSAEMIDAVNAIDGRSSAPALDRTPNARDEEQLSKIALDTVYNTAFRSTSGLSNAELAALGGNGSDGVINVARNASDGKYDVINGVGGMRKALSDAKDLYLMQETFKKVQKGEYTRHEAQQKLSEIGAGVLTPGEKENLASAMDEFKKSIGLATEEFYDRKESQFRPEDYGVSHDDTQAHMDYNSSNIEWQAREMHKKLYGDGIFDKFLAKAGLARDAGQTFMRCIDSGKNATIKTHSAGHEIKGCIDKLVGKYEQDAKESLQGIGEPMAAISGISGWMVIFSIFEKAAAARIKGMAARLEMQRSNDLNFLSSASNKDEFVAFEAALRNNREKVTEEMVDAGDMDRYMKEAIWGSHVFEHTQNPFLKHNDGLKKMMNASANIKGPDEDGKEIEFNAKAVAAGGAIESILASSGLGDEMKEFLRESKVAERNAYMVEKASMKMAIDKAKADRNFGDLIILQSRLVSLMHAGILSGAEEAVDDRDNYGKIHTLIVKEIGLGNRALELLKEEITAADKEIANLAKRARNGEGGSELNNTLVAEKLKLQKLQEQIPKMEELVKNMGQAHAEIKDAESAFGKHRSFGKGYNILDGGNAVAERFGGYRSSTAFLGQDLKRLDRFQGWLENKYPDKFKTEAVGNAAIAVKTVLRSLTFQQKAEKENSTVKEAYERYQKAKPKDALTGCDVEFHQVIQADDSRQMVMISKAVLGDIKALVSENGEKLYDSIPLGSKRKKDIEREITRKGLSGETAIAYRQEHEAARSVLGEFAAKCGFSQIGENRYADAEQNKGLSNAGAIGGARKKQGFFESMTKRSETVISRQGAGGVR